MHALSDSAGPDYRTLPLTAAGNTFQPSSNPQSPQVEQPDKFHWQLEIKCKKLVQPSLTAVQALSIMKNDYRS
jgi:hypothetical protein